MATTAQTFTWGLYVHKDAKGVLTIVDAGGKTITSPPDVKVAPDGSFLVMDSAGNTIPGSNGDPITLPAFSPPVYNVYAYTAADGKVTIVDASGNPVPIPPSTKTAPGGDIVAVDAQGHVIEDAGGPVEIPAYQPPTANLYVYTASDGTKTVVDATGNPVASPPLVDGKGVVVGAEGKAMLDAGGIPVTLPAYSPPTTNVYLYTASDGTTSVVDAFGNPVPSPPDFMKLKDGQAALVDAAGKPLLDAAGESIPLPAYKPPTSGVYYHVGNDGESPSGGEAYFVDWAGNKIPSPPRTVTWSTGYEVLADESGKPLLDDSGQVIPVQYYPPPTAGMFAKVRYDAATDLPIVTVVDANGDLLPNQPMALLESDAQGNLTGDITIIVPKVAIGSLSFETLTDESGQPIKVPMWEPTSVPRLQVYVGSDGSVDVVDATGKPVASPPNVVLDLHGQPVVADWSGNPITDEDGNAVTLPLYSPPTQGVYAHMVTDPTTGQVDVQIVDAGGNLVSRPPGYTLKYGADPTDPPTVVLTDAAGKELTDSNGAAVAAPLYSPPTQGVYAHMVTDPTTGQLDVQIVDAWGKPVSSPPGYTLKPVAGEGGPPAVVLTGIDGKPLTDEGGETVTAPLYSPPTQGVYAHMVTDPTTGQLDVQIVDAWGKPVSSPPGYTLKPVAGEGGPPVVVLTDAAGKELTDSNGVAVAAPLYSPPTQGVYAHMVTDPTTGQVDVQIVDAAGNLVSSPPGYTLKYGADPTDPPTVVLTDAAGKELTDSNGVAVAAPLYSPPTQGVYAHMVTDPTTGQVDVQIVDAAGNLVSSPPGYTLKYGADPTDPPTVVLTGPDGQPLTDEGGIPISVPLHASSAAPPGSVAPPEATGTGAEAPAGDGEDAADEVAEESDAEAAADSAAAAPATEAGDGQDAAAAPADQEPVEAAAAEEAQPAEVRAAASMEGVAAAAAATTLEVGDVASAESAAADIPDPLGLGEAALADVLAESELAASATAEPGHLKATDVPELISAPDGAGPVELDDRAALDSPVEEVEFALDPVADTAAIEEPSVLGAETVSVTGLASNELSEVLSDGLARGGVENKAGPEVAAGAEVALADEAIIEVEVGDIVDSVEDKVGPEVAADAGPASLEEAEFKFEELPDEVGPEVAADAEVPTRDETEYRLEEIPEIEGWDVEVDDKAGSEVADDAEVPTRDETEFVLEEIPALKLPDADEARFDPAEFTMEDASVGTLQEEPGLETVPEPDPLADPLTPSGDAVSELTDSPWDT